MSEMVDVISGEFEDAFEVRNSKSLHRGIFLLLSSSVSKEEHLVEHNDLKTSIMALNSNVELITSRMEEGFKRMDERFEAVDKRFNRQTAMMSIGFLVITTLISVYRFLG